MSVQDIVLRGFGSTGSVSLIVTKGFGGAITELPSTPSASFGSGRGIRSRALYKRKKKRREEQLQMELMQTVEYQASMDAADMQVITLALSEMLKKIV